ncbi:hypothetical protein [Agrobacterium cavarae]|uniref:hypothetical protein n=1 Tax=Agrobacterium cavarae TaxID=2528239 RepID=UPI002FDB45C4
MTVDNIKLLVEWLGEDGAQVGLDKSTLTVAELRNLLKDMGKEVPSKARRRDIISEIIFGATKRIDAPIEELLAMNADMLLSYFEEKRPSRTELLKLLGELDFHPGSEAQKSLYKYAARQIAETGMFQRVAHSRKP